MLDVATITLWRHLASFDFVKKIKLYQDPRYKRTLIFDLDETLVHCLQNDQVEADLELEIEFGKGQLVAVRINIRPYTREILERLSKQYEIIVFTASFQCYADKILDYLDPKRELIKHRLYRDHCLQTQDGIYLKDLRIFKNRDLSNVILIDNSAYSYCLQPSNAIPIIPFYDNKEDKELKDLTQYLLNINLNQFRSKDIRDILGSSFMLERISQQISIEDAYKVVVRKISQMGYGFCMNGDLGFNEKSNKKQMKSFIDRGGINIQVSNKVVYQGQCLQLNQLNMNGLSQYQNQQQQQCEDGMQYEQKGMDQIKVELKREVDIQQYRISNIQQK